MTYKTIFMLPFALVMAGCGGATTTSDPVSLLAGVDIGGGALSDYDDRVTFRSDTATLYSGTSAEQLADISVDNARFTGQSLILIFITAGGTEEVLADTFVDVDFTTNSFSGAMGRFQSDAGLRDGEFVIVGDTQSGSLAIFDGMISGTMDTPLAGTVEMEIAARANVRGDGGTNATIQQLAAGDILDTTLYDRWNVVGFLAPD